MANTRRMVPPLVGAAVLALSVAACSDVDKSLFEQHRPKTQGDAGSIHLAVAPPIPFASVSQALMPSFKLEGDDALKAAIPDTTYIENRFFQMVSASLGLGLSNPAAVGASNSNQAPTAKAPDGKLADSGKSLLATGDAQRPLKEDPILQYSAATALYQEVRLLERYVSYAAQRQGYKAFVQRMNIGVQPFARSQPYDVFSSIGFFSPDPQCPVPPGRENHPNRRQPYILPLLVTDNLEGISSARSAEMITQIALAVSVLAQGISGNASFGYTRDRLKSILGTDLNSLLTVSRDLDNVIQVRLGAPSQPTSRFAMVPSNHTITVIMLVPTEQFITCKDSPYAPNVRVTMKSSLRDAVTGELLLPDRNTLLPEVKRSLLRAGIPEKTAESLVTTDQAALEKLMLQMRLQRRDQFDIELRKLGEAAYSNGYRDGIWVALSELQVRSEYQTAVVVLCDPDKGSHISCPTVKEPTKPKDPPSASKPNTASGTAIYTTITTTTTPPTPAKP